MPEYRGFVSFTSSEEEFEEFKERINNFYNWCLALDIDPTDDENYYSFCEAWSVYENG